MGSIAAMSSIERVLDLHGAELLAEHRLDVSPGTMLTYLETTLSNNVHNVSVEHTFRAPDGRLVILCGEPIEIDTLAERYPDSRVGY